MKKISIVLFFIFIFLGITSCEPNEFDKKAYKPVSYKPKAVVVKVKEETDVSVPDEKGIYAVIETNVGDLVLQLFYEEAPNTVQNFIDLAQGQKEVEIEGKKVKKRFYDGLTFHRVVPNFMVQTGCPKGDGTGGPGYNIEDEINAIALGLDKIKMKDAPYYNRYLQQAVVIGMGLKTQAEVNERKEEVENNLKAATELSVLEILYRNGYRYNEVLNSKKAVKGSLAMANKGIPNTNGSQFFINQVDTPHLNGLHTVFGHLVSKFSVLEQIVLAGNFKTKIDKVTIIDKR
ncbi:MAG: peptidylprolyl isomerase [Leptospiraceae bacterium]|nr:peptidylprolyl isomerase [Leptospiraceae bacterium]MCP5494615.1 peptidylprolyl isomerase [Leptospiraceae bacterium]